MLASIHRLLGCHKQWVHESGWQSGLWASEEPLDSVHSIHQVIKITTWVGCNCERPTITQTPTYQSPSLILTLQQPYEMHIAIPLLLWFYLLTGSRYIDQASLELMIALPQSREC